MPSEQNARSITVREDFEGMLQIWPPSESNKRTRFDLVLVPGLTGGCITTWIHENGACWLDWLLREICDIRIFAFGYKADNVYLKTGDEQANTHARIFTDAENLCNALRDDVGRRENPCPITFISHGVGGIIVRNALVMCNALPRLYRQILHDTHHILFLDTPHLGLNTSHWLRIYGRSATDHAVRQLNLWSQGLVDTAKYFGGISSAFSITSVYPTQPIECDGDTIFVVEELSSTLFLPNEIRIWLSNTNHLTMCKFSSLEDTNYKKLRDRIKAEIKRRQNLELLGTEAPVMSAYGKLDNLKDLNALPVNVTQSIEDREHFETKKLRYKVSKWLIPKDAAIDYDAELESDSVRAVGNTCTWIFDTTEYKTWISTPHSKVCWVYGIPGCGKSTLVTSTCKSLPKERKHILHFFFPREASFSTALALSSLTHQMVSNSDTVLEALRPKYEKTVASPALSEPAAAATFKIALMAFGHCYIFLDAMDNCKDRGQLLKNLKIILDEIPFGIKIFCSSLEEDDIERTFSGWSSVIKIKLTKEKIGADIDTFVRATIEGNAYLMEKLHNHPDDLDRITIKLIDGAEGMFLLPKCFIADLSRLKDLAAMYKYLESLPSGINDYYLEIFLRLHRDYWAITREVLTWTAWVSRPLSLPELRQILRFTQGEFLCLEQDIKRALQCVISLENGFVRLSHDSIRRFVRDSVAFKSSQMYRNLIYSAPEDYIAARCVKFLLEPSYGPRSSPHPRFTGQKPAQIRETCPFLEYASYNWISHWASASMPLDLLPSVSDFFDSDRSLNWVETLGHFLVFEGFESEIYMLRELLVKLQRKVERLPKTRGVLVWAWPRLFRLRKISRKACELSTFLNSWGAVIQQFPDEIHILAPLLRESFSQHPAQDVLLTSSPEWKNVPDLYNLVDGLTLPLGCDRFLLSDLHIFAWPSLMPSISWNYSCMPLKSDEPGVVRLILLSMATRLPRSSEAIDAAEVGSFPVTTSLRKDHRVVGISWARYSEDKSQPLAVKTYAWYLTEDPRTATLIPIRWTYMGRDDPFRVDVTHTQAFRMSRCAVAFADDMQTMWTVGGPYNISTGNHRPPPSLFIDSRMMGLTFSENCSIVAGIRDQGRLEIYSIPHFDCVASYNGDCTLLGVSRLGKFVLFLEKLGSEGHTAEILKIAPMPRYAVSLLSISGTKTTIWSDDQDSPVEVAMRSQSTLGITESNSIGMLYNNGGLHAFSPNDKILVFCVYAWPNWELLGFDLESTDIKGSRWSIDYASMLSGAGIMSLSFCPINERQIYILDTYGVIRSFDVTRSNLPHVTDLSDLEKEELPPITTLIPESSERPVLTITTAPSPYNRNIPEVSAKEWTLEETPRKRAYCTLGHLAKGVCFLESDTIIADISPMTKFELVDQVSHIRRWNLMCTEVQKSIETTVSNSVKSLERLTDATPGKVKPKARAKVTTNISFDSSATLGFFYSLVYVPHLADDNEQPQWVVSAIMDVRWLEVPKWRKSGAWYFATLTGKEKESLITTYHPPSRTLVYAVSLLDYNKATNQHLRETSIMVCQLSSQLYTRIELDARPNYIISRRLRPDCGFVETLEFSNCGNYVFGYSSTWPGSIFQLDIRNGKEEIVREIYDPFGCGTISCITLSFHDNQLYVAGVTGVTVSLLRFSFGSREVYDSTILASCPNEVQICSKLSLTWPSAPNGKLMITSRGADYFRKDGKVTSTPVWPVIISVPLEALAQWEYKEYRHRDLYFPPQEAVVDRDTTTNASEPQLAVGIEAEDAFSLAQGDKPSESLLLEAEHLKEQGNHTPQGEDQEKKPAHGCSTSCQLVLTTKTLAPDINTNATPSTDKEENKSNKPKEFVCDTSQGVAELRGPNLTPQTKLTERQSSGLPNSEFSDQRVGSYRLFRRRSSFSSILRMLCCPTKTKRDYINEIGPTQSHGDH